MWELVKHKEPKGLQDLEVKVLLNEMAEYTYATYALSFENSFKERIQKAVSKTNSFSASMVYKVVYNDEYSQTIDIWKTTVKGDLKQKMYTLNYIKESINPIS